MCGGGMAVVGIAWVAGVGVGDVLCADGTQSFRGSEPRPVSARTDMIILAFHRAIVELIREKNRRKASWCSAPICCVK